MMTEGPGASEPFLLPAWLDDVESGFSDYAQSLEVLGVEDFESLQQFTEDGLEFAGISSPTHRLKILRAARFGKRSDSRPCSSCGSQLHHGECGPEEDAAGDMFPAAPTKSEEIMDGLDIVGQEEGREELRRQRKEARTQNKQATIAVTEARAALVADPENKDLLKYLEIAESSLTAHAKTVELFELDDVGRMREHKQATNAVIEARAALVAEPDNTELAESLKIAEATLEAHVEIEELFDMVDDEGGKMDSYEDTSDEDEIAAEADWKKRLLHSAKLSNGGYSKPLVIKTAASDTQAVRNVFLSSENER